MGSLINEIYDAEHLLCKGFHEINEKDSLDKNTLEMLGELLDAAKDMYTVQMYAEYPPEYSQGNYSRNDYPMRGYSRDDYSMRSGDYMYDGNQSYARRRDSRGRYSRGHGDDMIARLEEKMNNAPNEQEREKYRKMIIEMENM